MAVRVYVRSPAALGCTLLGAIAVGTIVAIGLWIAVTFRDTVTNPAFLDGLGQLLYVALFGAVVVVARLVWLPFGAGVAYAVGQRVRGEPTTFGGTLAAVGDRSECLYRWGKTYVAVGPLADHLLSEDDVASDEVAAGCEPFVIPAIVLDASTLTRAVERANRMTPQPGRERLWIAGLGATAAVVAVVFSVGRTVPEPFDAVAMPVVVGSLIVGVVVTAAVDVAWRADVYASRNLSEGFSPP